MAVDIGVFVTLLIVSVIEISAVTRSLDLERINKKKLPPFFIGLFFLLDSGSSQQKVSIPQLGRFNFIHGANLAIIFLGFVLIVENTDGRTGLFITLITFVIWALFPLLEVDEYEEILIDGYRPVSYYHHVLMVLIASLVIFSYDTIWSMIPYFVPILVEEVLLLAICVLFYYIMLFGFLKHLERELDRIDTDRLPDKVTKTEP
jgi:hypothetical protein